jgi:methionyl-tRNA formyltransferase
MSKLPKVVYFGADAICLPGLQYLHLSAGDICELAGVISQPDRPQGRGKRLQANPVSAYALAQGIPLLQPSKPDAELVDWLQSHDVSVAFVMAYGHFLPRAVREAPTFGMWNFHGSLLPKYRGASPAESAIAEGESETGVCLMRVVKAMDGGAVADYESVSIGPSMTSPELRVSISEAVVPLLERNLKAACLGELITKEQDTAQATYCRKLFKQDGAIDFELSAQAIYDRMRAFTPWPGAYFEHEEVRIKVGSAKVLRSACTSEPGTVLSANQELLVATDEGVIGFAELQRPGGKLLPTSDFLRGYPICQGEMLSGGKSVPLVRKEP